ncbi:hypothetical protein AAVH_37641 [Aphelenchoides avenae]|nr:hypothetical protein AAVH_37641 [Aphelenchus avenae]
MTPIVAACLCFAALTGAAIIGRGPRAKRDIELPSPATSNDTVSVGDSSVDQGNDYITTRKKRLSISEVDPSTYDYVCTPDMERNGTCTIVDVSPAAY